MTRGGLFAESAKKSDCTEYEDQMQHYTLSRRGMMNLFLWGFLSGTIACNLIFFTMNHFRP